MKNAKLSSHGFSLVEVLIVFTIFGLFAVMANQAILSILKTNRKSDTQTDIKQNGSYAVSLIEHLIRNGSFVKPQDTECTGFETNLTSISFHNKSNDSVLVSSEDENGVCRIYSQLSGQSKDYITSSLYTLGTCPAVIFSCATISGGTTSVKLDFSLTRVSGDIGISDTANFKTIINTRQ